MTYRSESGIKTSGDLKNLEIGTFNIGQSVGIRDLHGKYLRRVAVSTVIEGGDFPVIWACSEREWRTSVESCRPVRALPWPAIDVFELMSNAATIGQGQKQ